MTEEPEQNSRTHYVEYLCSRHEGERYPLVGAGYYPGAIDIGMRYIVWIHVWIHVWMIQ
jgi:hypothetical protein